KIVEIGPTEDIINNPQHPYTKGLIKAIPGTLEAGSRLYQIPGMMPTLTDIPPGCAFHPRCEFSRPICETKSPVLISVNDHKQTIACHVLGKNLS
nr:methionine ABC transporter ATP-binding protein [Deltaproteobacteria bacterium]